MESQSVDLNLYNNHTLVTCYCAFPSGLPLISPHNTCLLSLAEDGIYGGGLGLSRELLSFPGENTCY